MLHVTNGASAAARIRAAGHDGAVLTWDDVLHEGPLAAWPEARALRAGFLAERGAAPAAARASLRFGSRSPGRRAP